MSSKKRPQSGNKRKFEGKELSNSRLRPSSAKISNSQASQKSLSTSKREWQFKGQKVKMFGNAKMIPVIHAYNPKGLKKCLVTNPKSYKKFYDQQGSCELTKLYSVSFIAHFREWRKSLRFRVVNLINAVSQTEVLEQDLLTQVLEQLCGISQQLKECLQSILKSRNSTSSFSEFKQQEQSFEGLREYIENVLSLLHFLFDFLKEVNTIMDEGAEGDVSDCKKKVRKLGKKYQTKLMKLLSYCSCHPESSLVNKAEFRLKNKYDQILKWSLDSLDNMEIMRKIKERFIININHIMMNQGDAESYTVPFLQEIAEVLNANDQFRLNNQDILNGPPSKALQIILKLNRQIDEYEIQFLVQFKFKSYLILKCEHDRLKSIKVIGSLKDQGEGIKTSKKKLLLLSKIYNRNQDASYHEEINNCIKETSRNFQQLQQITQLLISISKDKKYQSSHKVLKILKQLLDPIENFEINKQNICDQILKIVKNASVHPDDISNMEYTQSEMAESDKVELLIKIMECSENQTNDLLKTPAYVRGKEDVSEETIKHIIKQNNNYLQKMVKETIPGMIQYSNQLKYLARDQLIKELLLFEEDIDKEPVNCFHLLKEFYGTMYSKTDKEHKITRDAVIKMNTYFKEKMNVAASFKNHMIVKKYIEWMFENRVAIYLLESMGTVNQIIDQPCNQYFYANNENLSDRFSYEGRQKIQAYINIQQNVFEEIVANSSQYVQQISSFDLYFVKCLKRINSFITKQRIFIDFKESDSKGTYFPSADNLQNWLNWEFSYSIEQSIKECVIQAVRAEQHKLIEKMIHRLNGLILQSCPQYDLGKKFVEECKKKIASMTNYLLLSVQQISKSSFFVQENSNQKTKYELIANNILKFLRANQIYHIAICTKNQDPITFLPEGAPYQIEKVLSLFEKRLGLPPNTIERGNSEMFQQFQPAKIAKEIVQMQLPFDVTSKAEAKKQSAVQEIMGEEIEEDEKMEEEMQEVIGEEEMQQMIEEESIKEEKPAKKSQTKQKQSKYIFEDDDLKEKKREKLKYVYFKFENLKDIQTIKSCLAFAKEEFKAIQGGLDMGKFVLALDPEQPNAELVQHIEDILAKSSNKSLMSILNTNNKYSKSQKILYDFKQGLNSKNKEQRLTKFVNVLNLLSYKYETVYGQLFTNDFIVLIEMGESGHYCHACLTSSKEIKSSLLFSHQEIKDVELLFLDSLFGVRSEKNKNLDVIVEKITAINKQLYQKYEDFRNQFYGYKKYPIDNGLQIDAYVDKYIDSRTNGLSQFTPVEEINYQVYRNWLSQAELIIGCDDKKICKLLFQDSEQLLPLYLCWDYEEVKSLIQKTTLIPTQYNSGKYVERKNVHQALLKYNLLQNDILNQQLSVPLLEVKQILHLYFDPSALSSSKQCELRNKVEEINRILKKKEKYESIIKMGNVTEMKEEIEPKLTKLSHEKQIIMIILEQEKILFEEGQEKQKQDANFEKNLKGNNLGRRKLKYQRTSQEISKLHTKLESSNLSHKVIMFEGRIIGIVDSSQKYEDAVKSCLNCSNPTELKVSLIDPQVIQILQLRINFKLSDEVYGWTRSFLSVIDNPDEIINLFSLEVKGGEDNIFVYPLTQIINNPVSIKTGYPRSQIQFILKKNQNNSKYPSKKWEKVKSQKIQFYHYEETYVLRWVEKIIAQQLGTAVSEEKQKLHQIQMLRLEEQRKKQQQEAERKLMQERQRKLLQEEEIRMRRQQQERMKQYLEVRRLEEQNLKEQQIRKKLDEQKRLKQEQKRRRQEEQKRRRQEQQKRRRWEQNRRRQEQKRMRQEENRMKQEARLEEELENQRKIAAQKRQKQQNLIRQREQSEKRAEENKRKKFLEKKEKNIEGKIKKIKSEKCLANIPTDISKLDEKTQKIYEERQAGILSDENLSEISITLSEEVLQCGEAITANSILHKFYEVPPHLILAKYLIKKKK